jgi:hypothetical protein
MKLRVEFPAQDKVYEDEARVMQGLDDSFYIVTENYFVWVENTESLVKELLKFEDK